MISGYRVVLAFDLVYTGPSSLPVPESLNEQHQALTSLLSRWEEDQKSSQLLYFLDNVYTEANLRFGNLTGRDRKLVTALTKAAAETDFSIFLCSVARSIEGPAIQSEYERFGLSVAQGDGKDPQAGRHHGISEIYDEDLKLTQVLRLDDTILAERVRIGAKDIVQEDYFEGREADSESYRMPSLACRQCYLHYRI